MNIVFKLSRGSWDTLARFREAGPGKRYPVLEVDDDLKLVCKVLGEASFAVHNAGGTV